MINRIPLIGGNDDDKPPGPGQIGIPDDDGESARFAAAVDEICQEEINGINCYTVTYTCVLTRNQFRISTPMEQAEHVYKTLRKLFRRYPQRGQREEFAASTTTDKEETFQEQIEAMTECIGCGEDTACATCDGCGNRFCITCVRDHPCGDEDPHGD